MHLLWNLRYKNAIEELTRYPEVLLELERDPTMFAENRGIYFPPDTEVAFKEKGQQSWFGGFRWSGRRLFGHEGGSGGRGRVLRR